MLKGAKREHKTVMEIAQYYTDAFFEDCRKLNIKTPRRGAARHRPASTTISRSSPSCWTPATPTLAGGNVYFDTCKLEQLLCLQRPRRGGPGRGRPRGRGGGHQQAQQERLRPVVHQVQVRGSGPEVGLSLGRGLSRLAHRVLRHLHEVQLGEYLDLHCGGIDNAFPHHTNEIAQSESLSGPPLVPPVVPCATT